MQATNNLVWAIRTETPKESGGLFLPDSGKEKPHTATVISVGELVADKEIQKGKLCIFHKGCGQELEYKGTVYLILDDKQIIGIDEISK